MVVYICTMFVYIFNMSALLVPEAWTVNLSLVEEDILKVVYIKLRVSIIFRLIAASIVFAYLFVFIYLISIFFVFCYKITFLCQ